MLIHQHYSKTKKVCYKTKLSFSVNELFAESL